MPRFLAALTVLLLGYQTLVAMLFVGETRYRVPWDFLIALLAARARSSSSARECERVAGRGGAGRAPTEHVTSARRRFASSRS